MAGSRLEDVVLDAALDVVRTTTTQAFLCSQSPTNFTEAGTTYKLGTKASPSLGAIADNGGAGGGRKSTVASFSDGTLSAAGTGTHVALCTASALLAVAPLSSSISVGASGSWSSTAFDIIMKDPTE
jgi:hypothetical protein